MTPERAHASSFHYSDPYREGDDSRTGDSDPFWGYRTEGENASASTCRWGDVSVVELGALESPLSLYSPEYESSPLSPSFLFQESPGRAAGTAALPADIRQLSASERAPSPEPAQKLTRKRSREVEQAVALPAAKKTADRTVQIAGFSWTLPPDPGMDGPYPSLIFLIGAAISSSDSGKMTLVGIRQWIRARYPSMRQLPHSVSGALAKQSDFTRVQTGISGQKGLWRLHNPQQFGGYYERDMFLKRRRGIGRRNKALRNPSPAHEQKGSGAACPTIPVKFGDHILKLPLHRAGQEKPSIRFLCGCAIALGSEQGSGATEIAEWIADYYSVQDTNDLIKLKDKIRATLNLYKNDFLRTNIRVARIIGKGPVGMKWVLKNPAAFTANYWESALSYTVPPDGGTEQAVALPSVKEPADRTAQIAGFTWTLPPDPGMDGPYPSLIFLIGAAISSSDSGMMTVAEIRQWIRARYPSMRQQPHSLSGALAGQTDFTRVQIGIWDKKGLWRLHNPQQFRDYYEGDMFLKQRCGIGSRDKALRNPSSASEQKGSGAACPTISVKFGGHILTLPLYRAGQKKPPLRLLCGCAIALGSEQGSGVTEIAEWIVDYYSVQGASVVEQLKVNIRSTLNTYRCDFRHTNTYAPRASKRGPVNMRWTLINPADFAVRYGGSALLSTVPPDSGAEQTVATAAPNEPIDRMVQIADFTWALPPDPGKGGPYPSLIFLIGAAISSSDSGMMTLAEIRQWIRTRYPCKPVSPNGFIKRTLDKKTDFMCIRCEPGGMEGWKLRDPEQFRRYYEKSIFLKRRCGIGSRDIALRNPLPAPGQGSPWATSPVPGSLLSGQSACSGTESEVQIAPALSVKIGGSILTLPPYSAGQQKPPLRLLCGCAIALGSEQGANVKEIIEWIAGRYFVVEVDAIKVLDRHIRSTLGSRGGGFRRIKSTAPEGHKGRFIEVNWVLENPVDFAASYGGRICSQDS